MHDSNNKECTRNPTDDTKLRNIGMSLPCTCPEHKEEVVHASGCAADLDGCYDGSCLAIQEQKEDWEEKLKEFKYDDYSHRDDDNPCASNYTVIGNKYHGNGEKRPCDCGADSRWNELCSFFRTQISLAEERGREEAITYIADHEGWEESEDMYRKHFGFAPKYGKA